MFLAVNNFKKINTLIFIFISILSFSNVLANTTETNKNNLSKKVNSTRTLTPEQRAQRIKYLRAKKAQAESEAQAPQVESKPEEKKKEESPWFGALSLSTSKGFAVDTHFRSSLLADVNYAVYKDYKIGGYFEYFHVFTPVEDIDNNNAFEDPNLYILNSKLYFSEKHKFSFGGRLRGVFPGSIVSKKQGLNFAGGLRLNAVKGFENSSLEWRGEVLGYHYRYIESSPKAGSPTNLTYGFSNQLRWTYKFTDKFSTLLIGSVSNTRRYSTGYTNVLGTSLSGIYAITPKTYFNLTFAAKDKFDSKNSFFDDDNSLLSFGFDFLL